MTLTVRLLARIVILISTVIGGVFLDLPQLRASQIACNPANVIDECITSADGLRFRLYALVLCETAPTVPTTLTALDYSNCEVIYDRIEEGGRWISLDNGVGDSQQFSNDLVAPRNGTYRYFGGGLGLEWYLKKKITFNQPLFGLDGSQGSTCVTKYVDGDFDSECSDSSSIVAEPAYHSLNSIYDQYVYEFTEASTVLYVMRSDYKLSNSDRESDWMLFVRELGTPIVVTDDTRALKLSFDLSTAIQVDHDENSRPGQDIFDVDLHPFIIGVSVQ